MLPHLQNGNDGLSLQETLGRLWASSCPGSCTSPLTPRLRGAGRGGRGGAVAWWRLDRAPRAAAKRSARNLLTDPEQRAANPAGGRGRAGGRRDPAPSRLGPACRALIRPRGAGTAARASLPRGQRPVGPLLPPQLIASRARGLAGSHDCGSRPPTCPAASLAAGTPPTQPP